MTSDLRSRQCCLIRKRESDEHYVPDLIGHRKRRLPGYARPRRTRRRRSAGQFPFPSARTGKFHEILDLADLLGTEGLDLFDQSIDFQAHIRLQMLFL